MFYLYTMFLITVLQSIFKTISYLTQHDHRTINNPKSLYSIPYGPVILPLTKTKIGKQSVKYLCSEK